MNAAASFSFIRFIIFICVVDIAACPMRMAMHKQCEKVFLWFDPVFPRKDIWLSFGINCNPS